MDDIDSRVRACIDQWWSENREEFDYVDNERIALKGDAAQEKAYELIANGGCCGSCDIELETPLGTVLYGFNHGH